ncbi:hypothetical protein [Actinoplanes sp. NPDC023714]|uniref:hypothetical protein n=1 Tax=Actinoplanes sp. NPDC023714 TaxID=3154322 RepID=UPI00341077CE
MHEIARRAGAVTGTVSRHFPTAEAAAGADPGHDVSGRLRALLAAAQLAGGVRPDVAYQTSRPPRPARDRL